MGGMVENKRRAWKGRFYAHTLTVIAWAVNKVSVLPFSCGSEQQQKNNGSIFVFCYFRLAPVMTDIETSQQ